VAEHFLYANRPSFRVKKMVLILMFEQIPAQTRIQPGSKHGVLDRCSQARNQCPR
jgi:hypothetical protein